MRLSLLGVKATEMVVTEKKNDEMTKFFRSGYIEWLTLFYQRWRVVMGSDTNMDGVEGIVVK